MKAPDSIRELPEILLGLSMREENGILGVRVKSVDIEKNTCGEDGSLVHN